MDKLEELRPKHQERVMDLVEKAGIDISDWANFNGGIEKAAANPKYCYEWSFVSDEKKIIVLNLWYSNIEVFGDDIVQKINLHITAKNASGPQKNRAFKMDFALQKADREHLPLRLIICDGKRNEKIWASKAKVERRLLDHEPWHVKSYDKNNGDCVLLRGKYKTLYIDQFEAFPEEISDPVKKETIALAYERSPFVRRQVLERAKGCCEWCGEKGFITNSGSIYVETHHIVPLSEGGKDSVSNVIGICPNHHREAHFSQESEKIQIELLNIVKKRNRATRES